MPDSVAVLLIVVFLIALVSVPTRARFERAVRPREGPGFLARRRAGRAQRERDKARRRRHLRALR